MTAALGVRRVRVPFRVPVETAAGTWAARDSLLIELRSEIGARGVGEAPIDGALSTAILTAHVQRLIDGTGEGVPEPLRHAFGAGLGGALLDLASPPEPVASALRAGVVVNATVGADGLEETVRAAVDAVAAGYRTIKLKAAARERASDLVERLHAVRGAVGPEIELRLDANGAWDLEGAVERLRRLDIVGLQYVEQPLPVAARGAAAQLRARVGVRIAADEAVTSPDAARALVEAGAADVLVVKPARVGGPGAVAAIAEAAAERDVPVVVSTLFETGIGLAAAIGCASALPDVAGWPAAERAHGLATADVLEDDLLRAPLMLRGDRLRAPFGAGSAGLGVTVDEEAVERYAVDDA